MHVSKLHLLLSEKSDGLKKAKIKLKWEHMNDCVGSLAKLE